MEYAGHGWSRPLGSKEEFVPLGRPSVNNSVQPPPFPQTVMVKFTEPGVS